MPSELGTTAPASDRYDVEAVRGLVARLFVDGGMADEMAGDVTECLLMADMMGHSTHGLAIAPWYLEEIRRGGMNLKGSYEVRSDRGACVAWNGRRLPGAWLINRAIDLAMERIADHGVVTLTIAGGHHTGALATYLPRLTERGLMVQLACSGPASGGVAPFGGTRGIFTPNPLSAGIPSRQDPILLDISCSITTIKRSVQLAEAGRRYPGAWALDAEGNPSDDPRVLMSGNGSLMPVGGLDHGHKGYALALLVEALTQGLSGVGRRDGLTGIAMNTFLQVIDPGAFGGTDAFLDETTWLIGACHANPPRSGLDAVRVPGDRARARVAEALKTGVLLDPFIVAALEPHVHRIGETFPPSI
ncbi:Ldh family oxidoreductase [Sinorhizobium americanum]|uniref:Malate dehydrogenase n=1 Tax=Sinorhizobium americanum TaxID=194963 RepID=A0A1L3LSJ2_9HYPH|nr:Ldh family oxidoreductase [Sinorhizobium americanum]APG93047.1 malate dehydrogenase [Sinorhizobium americanum]OAP35884.1 lactate dehydrogenase [Sinorhizobium americanum]